MGRDELDEAVHAPLARACFVLAREFGWTPDECAELTVGQVLLYLEMLGRGSDRARETASERTRRRSGERPCGRPCAGWRAARGCRLPWWGRGRSPS